MPTTQTIGDSGTVDSGVFDSGTGVSFTDVESNDGDTSYWGRSSASSVSGEQIGAVTRSANDVLPGHAATIHLGLNQGAGVRTRYIVRTLSVATNVHRGRIIDELSVSAATGSLQNNGAYTTVDDDAPRPSGGNWTVWSVNQAGWGVSQARPGTPGAEIRTTYVSIIVDWLPDAGAEGLFVAEIVGPILGAALTWADFLRFACSGVLESRWVDGRRHSLHPAELLAFYRGLRETRWRRYSISPGRAPRRIALPPRLILAA